MASPLVTVVTPAFNSAATLAETWDSIRAQTLIDWEWRVVDDGSTDATPDLLTRIAAGDARIHVARLATNSGAAAARNHAIAEAQGRFIAFLDADDLWMPDKLARQTAMMTATGTGLSYGAYDLIGPDGAPRGHVTVPARTNYDALLRRNAIGCLTAVYDTALYGRVLMPPIRMRQDYGLWLKLLRDGGTARAVDGTLAQYRQHPASLSANKIAAAHATWALFRQTEGLNLPRSAYYFAHYATGTLARLGARTLAMRRGVDNDRS